MNEIETQWMKYVRTVYAEGCWKCCLDPHGSNSAPKVRLWPGYLGPDYATGRVLLIGERHNDDAFWKSPGITNFNINVADWCAKPEDEPDDDVYLDAVRGFYPAATKDWKSGSVWARFYRIIGALGLPIEQVAFTNLAKCTDQKDDSNKAVQECYGAFDPLYLIHMLKPLITFIAKSERFTQRKFKHLVEKGGVIQFRNGGQPDVGLNTAGEPEKVWLPKAVERYEKARRAADAALSQELCSGE
jgi:hypothetical protein